MPGPACKYYIKRWPGALAWPGSRTDERYAEAARDVRLFLEGRRHDFNQKPRRSVWRQPSEKELFRNRQPLTGEFCCARSKTSKNDSASPRRRVMILDVLAYYAETPARRGRPFSTCAAGGGGGIAVNSIGKIWKNFDPQEFVPSLLKQLYLGSGIPAQKRHVSGGILKDRGLLEAR